MTDDVVAALGEQHAELDATVAVLSDEQWATPTPRCPGWVVSDVVLHLAQTDEMALASLQGRFHESLDVLSAGVEGVETVDDGAGALIEQQRGASPELVLERWRSASSGVRDALAAIDPSARVQWVVGDMAARTLASTRLAECWIHTGDVLTALDRPVVESPRLHHIARLAWRTLPYAFTRAGRTMTGAVQFVLQGPGGEIWEFMPTENAATVVEGSALDLCLVAGQRADAGDTSLSATGPDASAVLSLVRTFA